MSGISLKKGETKTADEIFREKAAAEGVAALEEAVFKSAKTASILGNEEAMKKMVEKYAKYYPTGKFIGEARRLSVEKSDNPNSEF